MMAETVYKLNILSMSLDEIIEARRKKKNPKLARRKRFGKVSPDNSYSSFRNSNTRKRKRRRGQRRRSAFKLDKRKVNDEAEYARINIANLACAVDDEDMEQLFSVVGPVIKARVHYDSSGHSLGLATVVFQKYNDALTALQRYNGVTLDSMPMNISILPKNQAYTMNCGCGDRVDTKATVKGGHKVYNSDRGKVASNVQCNKEDMSNKYTRTCFLPGTDEEIRKKLDAELDEYSKTGTFNTAINYI